MPLNSNWFACKLNGVPFICLEASIPELGRKTATFDYPNTDSRYIEDMGGIRGAYQITAKIEANKLSPSSFKRNKKRFEEALNRKGLSVLIHPTKGRKEVVIVKAQGGESIQGKIGEATYNFVAVESDRNKFPTKLDNKKGLLNKLYDSLSDKNKKLLEGITKFASDSLESYNAMRDGVTAFTDGVAQAIGAINGINDEISSLTADITNLKNSINDIINFPDVFAENFAKSLNRLIEVTTNFDDALVMHKNILRNTPPAINSSLQEVRIANTISNATRTALLANSYQLITAMDYANQAQVDNMIKEVEAIYSSINPLLIDDATFSIIEDMRTSTLTTLNNLKLKLPSVNIINTASLPAIALAYNFYYNSAGTQYENILNLNNIQDPSIVNGNIKIFGL